MLAGSIDNRTGNTAITSSQGSITQTTETAQVSGSTIALNANTGIGSATQVLRINASDTGRVDAVSASGDVHLREMAGDFGVGTIGGASVANVTLESDRDMISAGAGYVRTRSCVELLSDDGAIGARVIR